MNPLLLLYMANKQKEKNKYKNCEDFDRFSPDWPMYVFYIALLLIGIIILLSNVK